MAIGLPDRPSRYVVFQTRVDHQRGEYNAIDVPLSFHDGHINEMVAARSGKKVGFVPWVAVEANSPDEAVEKALAGGYHGYIRPASLGTRIEARSLQLRSIVSLLKEGLVKLWQSVRSNSRRVR